MYAWYVRNAYLENNLRVPGKTVQCGEAVDLGTIDVPAYVFAAHEDHIVPWQTAYASVGLLGGESDCRSRFVLGASGHIAGVINPAARNKRNYWIDGQPGSEPERWLASATAVPGSWWRDWSAWLAGHAGDPVAARSVLGNAQYPVREAAPGRYVRERVPEAH
jgi:polyhydroxyalkanoate synthase